MTPLYVYDSLSIKKTWVTLCEFSQTQGLGLNVSFHLLCFTNYSIMARKVAQKPKRNRFSRKTCHQACEFHKAWSTHYLPFVLNALCVKRTYHTQLDESRLHGTENDGKFSLWKVSLLQALDACWFTIICFSEYAPRPFRKAFNALGISNVIACLCKRHGNAS
jgi:hypothetical protein